MNMIQICVELKMIKLDIHCRNKLKTFILIKLLKITSVFLYVFNMQNYLILVSKVKKEKNLRICDLEIW